MSSALNTTKIFNQSHWIQSDDGRRFLHGFLQSYLQAHFEKMDALAVKLKKADENTIKRLGEIDKQIQNLETEAREHWEVFTSLEQVNQQNRGIIFRENQAQMNTLRKMQKDGIYDTYVSISELEAKLTKELKVMDAKIEFLTSRHASAPAALESLFV